MGCGVCANVCPTKSLTMVPMESQLDQQDVWTYMTEKVSEKKDMQDNTVKGSQFKQPMLEFSGSCAGCAETSYARLITQLFGDHMIISNATGCSSIWGGPAATSPYTVNKEGKGPAWVNSLFEDNAEHGLGLYLGQKKLRDDLAEKTRELIALSWCTPAIKEAAQKWLDTYNDGQRQRRGHQGLHRRPRGRPVHRGRALRPATTPRSRLSARSSPRPARPTASATPASSPRRSLTRRIT